MNRSTKIIIATTISLLVLGTLAVLVFVGRDDKKADEQTDTPAAQTEDQQVYTSMEDGEVLTEEAIEARSRIDGFARDEVREHLKNKYPNHKTILIISDEWYFTDQNNSDNILIYAEIVDADDSIVKEMNVVEIGQEGDNYINMQIYKPDSRYSL